MKIHYHKEFLRNYRKRIAPNPTLISKFRQRLQMLTQDAKNPLLRDHKLIGKKSSYRAFSVTGDIRVIYRIVDDSIWLYDIGSHNQVY